MYVILYIGISMYNFDKSGKIIYIVTVYMVLLPYKPTVDYTLTTPLSLTISGLDTGEVSCFSIEVIDDNLFEDDKSFTLHLSTGDASVLIGTPYATVTITNDDGMFNKFKYSSPFTISQLVHKSTYNVHLLESTPFVC